MVIDGQGKVAGHVTQAEWRKRIACTLLVVFVGSAIYFNTTGAAFSFDDNFAILYNGAYSGMRLAAADLFKIHTHDAAICIDRIFRGCDQPEHTSAGPPKT